MKVRHIALSSHNSQGRFSRRKFYLLRKFQTSWMMIFRLFLSPFRQQTRALSSSLLSFLIFLFLAFFRCFSCAFILALWLSIDNLKQCSYLKCSYLQMGSHGSRAHHFHCSIGKRCGKIGRYDSFNEIHVLYCNLSPFNSVTLAW